MPTVEENSATLALAARYGKLNAETWQKATQIEFGMADLLNFLEARRAVPAQASVDVEKLQADLDWHKASLAAHAGKLTSVWDGIREAVAKYSGKPCEGEPFDRLDELLRSMTSAQASAPAAVDTEVLHALLEKIHGTHNQAVNLAYCPSSEPFKAADRAFREAYRVLFEVIDALAAQSPSQGEMVAGPVAASWEAVAKVSPDELRDIQQGRMGVPIHGSRWRDDQTIPLYTAPTPPAPQEVEQARDAARLDFLARHEAWIAWGLDGEQCRVFHRTEEGDAEPILGWRHPNAWHGAPRAAIDAAMSAQPDDSGKAGA